MFRHYFIMATKGLLRHKLYTVINLVSLAAGLTCVIFVVLFVRYEFSYDKWIPGTQNVYRVETTIYRRGRGPLRIARIPYPLPVAMRRQIPGVRGMTRFTREVMALTSGDRQFAQTVDVVDPNFFKVIRLPVVLGNPSTVLSEPNTVVLTQSAAKKYFGRINPLGQILIAKPIMCSVFDAECRNKRVALRVTGILRNIPPNTQLSGNVFISIKSRAADISPKLLHNWLAQQCWGYLTLAPGVDAGSVVAATAHLLDQDLSRALRAYGISTSASKIYRIHLTPFTRVHLTSARWRFNPTPSGSYTTVYGAEAIGALTLLMACFNFMNLATALSTARAREIAMRKALGARRSQLIVQFLGEAVFVAILSLALALASAEILSPIFDSLLGRSIGLRYAISPSLIIVLLGITILAGIVGGGYPALVLSRFQPIKALRGDGPRKGTSGGIRNLLVLLQFSVSIGLAITAGVIFNQIQYARALHLGFRHHDMLVVQNQVLNGKAERAFADALRANPGVVSVGLSNEVPFDSLGINSLIQIHGRPNLMSFRTVVAGPYYPKTYGIALVAGRFLSASRGDDRLSSMGLFRRGGVLTRGDPGNEGRNILINVAGARRLGLNPRQAVGATVEFNHSHVRIVGVLADAKVHGALGPVMPTAYIYVPDLALNIAVRLRPGSIPETLRFIDKTWHAFRPNTPIMRYFLDQSFSGLYEQVDRQGSLLAVFVAVAILIGCLGLYGLAVFSGERRTKEIGIRKISGACITDIVRLMLWRISAPVLVANVVAWPLAYWYLRGWLEGFAYRISLEPLYFLAAGATALAIAWSTVFTHSLHMARTHPVQALRYE